MKKQSSIQNEASRIPAARATGHPQAQNRQSALEQAETSSVETISDNPGGTDISATREAEHQRASQHAEAPDQHDYQDQQDHEDHKDQSEQHQQPEPEPLDCGRFVAAQMLDRALGKAARPARPGLFIVHVPDSAWVPVFKDVINRYFTLPPGQVGHRTSRRQWLRKGPDIRCHTVPATGRASDRLKDTDQMLAEITEGLAKGAAVFVIVDDLNAVPLSLRRAADRIILVPPPNRPALIALLRKITPGVKRIDLLDIPVEQLTPRMLCLAYRQETTPRPFLRRLKQLSAAEPKITEYSITPFERLHGVDEVKIWAAELKTDLERFAEKKLTWPQARRSLLLCGVPGTAKTTLAGAIAAHCDMAFVPTSYAQWQRAESGHLGDVLRNMAESFAEARARAPSVLFIDELDTLGSRGSGNKNGRDDWWRSIINALLEQIAGVESNEGVILIGATNYPDLIDPAILRSGRMEDRITLHPPEPDALARIFADELEGQCDATVDALKIAHMGVGMTGADVVRICAAARRRARDGNRPITRDDLVEVLRGGDKSLSAEYRRRIAIHEAGHAVVMHQLEGVAVRSISLMGSEGMAGFTRGGMMEGNSLTSSSLDTGLVALMGGRAAEEVLLGEVSAGSGGAEGSDLCRATLLAAEAELSLGLGTQGLTWHQQPSASNVGDWLARRPDVARAVGERLDRAYAKACAVIKAKVATVQRLTEALLRHQVLVGDELARLLDDGLEDAPGAAPDHGRGDADGLRSEMCSGQSNDFALHGDTIIQGRHGDIGADVVQSRDAPSI